MKKQLFLIALLFPLLMIRGQSNLQLTWQRAYGGSQSDKGYIVIKTSDGNLIWSGAYKSNDGDFTANQGNYDIFVTKTDPAGNVMWQKVFGGSNADYVNDIIEDSNGNILLTGSSKSNDGDITGNHGNYDVIVVKLDASGNILWQKSFGGSSVDKGMGIIQDGNNYIVAGYTKSDDDDITGAIGNYDVWLLKLDDSGNLVSKKNIGGTDADKINRIYALSNGNFMLTAYSKSADGDVGTNRGNYDFWIVEINDSLNIVRSNTYGGSGLDEYPVMTEISPNYVFAGSTTSSDGQITGAHGSFDIWLWETGANGTLLDEKSIGGTDADFATDLQVLDNSSCNCLAIAGYSNSDDGDLPGNYGSYDAIIALVDSNGTITDIKNFGGSNTEQFRRFVQMPDITAIGYTKSSDQDVSGQHGNYDAWMTTVNYAVSDISSINQDIANIYPNPASSYVNIEVKGLSHIQIIDLTGKTVLDKYTENDKIKFDVSGLTKGNYFIRIFRNKSVETRKLLLK